MSNTQILKRLLMAPIMGGLFVVFLPLIGFILLGKFLIERSLTRPYRLSSISQTR